MLNKIYSLTKKIFLVLILAFIIGESSIRLYLFLSKRNRPIWIPDFYLGAVHAKENQFVYRYSDGSARNISNSFGLIGPQVSIKKPEGIKRIAILGDSYTEALQVPYQDNFCMGMEAILNKRRLGNKGIEVLNAGLAGYSPLAEYIYYKRNISVFKPDLVVLQIFANDVFDDNKFGSMADFDSQGLPLRLRIFWPDSRNDANWNRGIRSYLVEHSRLAEYIYLKAVKSQKKSKLNRLMNAKEEFNDQNQFFIIDSGNILFKDNKFKDKLWSKTRKYIASLNNLVRDSGARFMVFYIPMEGQLLMGKYSVHVYSSAQNLPFNRDFNFLLKEFCEKEKIPYLDLQDDFQLHSEKMLYLETDGHLTKTGHRVVAYSLAEFIIKNNLLDSRYVK